MLVLLFKDHYSLIESLNLSKDFDCLLFKFLYDLLEHLFLLSELKLFGLHLGDKLVSILGRSDKV